MRMDDLKYYRKIIKEHEDLSNLYYNEIQSWAVDIAERIRQQILVNEEIKPIYKDEFSWAYRYKEIDVDTDLGGMEQIRVLYREGWQYGDQNEILKAINITDSMIDAPGRQRYVQSLFEEFHKRETERIRNRKLEEEKELMKRYEKIKKEMTELEKLIESRN